MSNTALRLAAIAAVGLFSYSTNTHAEWELNGVKSVIVTTAEGERIKLGNVSFTPMADGASSFRLSLDNRQFSDHFLSMRGFKCIQGPTELTCHVPYPYQSPNSVRRDNLVWLEHNLLFFYKLSSDFGAKLWNGIYFELKLTDSGLVGKPKAVDLDRISAPPDDPSVPPFGPDMRDDMPANARWLRSLSIE